MIRIFVEIDETNNYAADETKAFAEKLATTIKKKLNRKLYDIDADENWFVGFLELDTGYIKKVASLFREWAENEGLGTNYSIEDMNGIGHLCNQHDCICDGCTYSYDGEPCRLGYTEA